MVRYGARIGVKPAPLTQRQQQILALYAQGMRHKAIAEMLCISYKTVNSTLDRIQINLVIDDRWKLRDYARQHGLDTVQA